MRTTPESNLTWVRYDASRVIVSVMGLSPGAELAHHRLSALFWATGRWPLADPSVAPQQARSTPGQWPAILAELAHLGWRPQGEHLVNPAVGAVLSEARQVRRARLALCRAASKARWSRCAKPGTAPGPIR